MGLALRGNDESFASTTEWELLFRFVVSIQFLFAAYEENLDKGEGRNPVPQTVINPTLWCVHTTSDLDDSMRVRHKINSGHSQGPEEVKKKKEAPTGLFSKSNYALQNHN